MREAGDPRWDTGQLRRGHGLRRPTPTLLGLRGIRVDDPDQVGPAWDAAFAADRPVVLDVVTDKNVPPLPAHISFDQAKGVAEAILHRDPDALKVVEQQRPGRRVAAVRQPPWSREARRWLTLLVAPGSPSSPEPRPASAGPRPWRSPTPASTSP